MLKQFLAVDVKSIYHMVLFQHRCWQLMAFSEDKLKPEVK